MDKEVRYPCVQMDGTDITYNNWDEVSYLYYDGVLLLMREVHTMVVL